MTAPKMRESRPGGNQAASVLAANTLTVPTGTDDDFVAVLSEADATRSLEGSFAVFVVTRDAAGHVRRRPYLSLSSAERAVERAEARSHAGQIVLVRLQPIGPICPGREVGLDD